MAIYQHILVPIDLTDKSQKLLARASAIAAMMEAKLSLIHTVDEMYSPPPEEITEDETEMEDPVKTELAAFAEKNQIPSERCHLEYGLTKTAIHSFVKNHEVDLVIMGSHGRHGVQLLLGSTANAVLHGATCDVLAVRI